MQKYPQKFPLPNRRWRRIPVSSCNYIVHKIFAGVNHCRKTSFEESHIYIQSTFLRQAWEKMSQTDIIGFHFLPTKKWRLMYWRGQIYSSITLNQEIINSCLNTFTYRIDFMSCYGMFLWNIDEIKGKSEPQRFTCYQEIVKLSWVTGKTSQFLISWCYCRAWTQETYLEKRYMM